MVSPSCQPCVSIVAWSRTTASGASGAWPAARLKGFSASSVIQLVPSVAPIPSSDDEGHCLGPVRGLADHVDVVGRAEQDHEAAAYEGLVVGHRDADHPAPPVATSP
jgi:hypothetical protein